MPEIGDLNIHGQRLLRKTAEAGNHRFARLWVIRCENEGCGEEYGANSCDFHIRRCPRHGGVPGLAIEELVQ